MPVNTDDLSRCIYNSKDSHTTLYIQLSGLLLTRHTSNIFYSCDINTTVKQIMSHALDAYIVYTTRRTAVPLMYVVCSRCVRCQDVLLQHLVDTTRTKIYLFFRKNISAVTKKPQK